MNAPKSAFWDKLKTHRLGSSLLVLVTLAVGILIGTVISYSVRGQDKNNTSSDATPLTVPAPKQLSTTFSQIAKQLEPAVVNINTESTIKNPHRRTPGGRGRATPVPGSHPAGAKGPAHSVLSPKAPDRGRCGASDRGSCECGRRWRADAL